MWIIRFHKLKTSDYNFITRECKKGDFLPRKLSPILYAKAMVLFLCKKKSWRQIGEELGTSHIYFFHFYQKYEKSEMLSRILTHLADSRVALYIGEKHSFTVDELDNSDELLVLTKSKLKSMMTP